MAIDPATISAVGSLASGIGSLFGGGGDSPPGPLTQARQSIRGIVEGANATGLHPLYAMGASISPIAPTSIGPSKGDRLRDAGNALSSYGQAQQQKELNQAAVQESRARAQREIATARKEDMVATQIMASMGKRQQIQQNSQQDIYYPPMHNGMPQLYIEVWDNKEKKVIRLPNPDIGIEMPETIGLGYWTDAKMFQMQGSPVNPYYYEDQLQDVSP